MRGGQGRGYSPPRAPAIVTVSSPAAMRFLALLLAAQMVASPDTVPPYLTFPEPGLDDPAAYQGRSEEHTSELQSHHDLVCRLLLEKKKHTSYILLIPRMTY